MKKLRIAVCNLEMGAGITRGYWQYFCFWRHLAFWRQWMWRNYYIRLAAQMMREQRIDLALCTEVKQVELLQHSSKLPHYTFLRASKRGEGLAILSRFPIIRAQAHPLPGGFFARILVEVVVDLDGERITVFLAHLALGRHAREVQSEAIAQIVSDTDGPFILAGDFNERQDTDGLRAIRYLPYLEEHFRPWTFPAWKPNRSLQRLFGRGVKVNQTWTQAKKPFADHLPLLADIDIP